MRAEGSERSLRGASTEKPSLRFGIAEAHRRILVLQLFGSFGSFDFGSLRFGASASFASAEPMRRRATKEPMRRADAFTSSLLFRSASFASFGSHWCSLREGFFHFGGADAKTRDQSEAKVAEVKKQKKPKKEEAKN
uniref:Uncharacterized protein n=1 Tax=Pediastrum duplex TaxID=3105 RepID=A0A2U8GIR8_PEDDU|nr:hypothetical protein [Pediastrum duplex]